MVYERIWREEKGRGKVMQLYCNKIIRIYTYIVIYMTLYICIYDYIHGLCRYVYIDEYICYIHVCVCACVGMCSLTPPFLHPMPPVFTHSHLSQIQSPRYFS